VGALASGARRQIMFVDVSTLVLPTDIQRGVSPSRFFVTIIRELALMRGTLVEFEV